MFAPNGLHHEPNITHLVRFVVVESVYTSPSPKFGIGACILQNLLQVFDTTLSMVGDVDIEAPMTTSSLDGGEVFNRC